MRMGTRKVDRNLQRFVNALVNSGNWVIVPGRKHLKLRLNTPHGITMPVADSSGDARALRNLISTVHRFERDCGLTETKL